MIQEAGYASWDDFDIEARLKAFWDGYTWEVVPIYDPVHRGSSVILDI